MNAYDFDETIFYPDCSVLFALWCAKRHPKLWLTYFPKVMNCLTGYKKEKFRVISLNAHFSVF